MKNVWEIVALFVAGCVVCFVIASTAWLIKGG